MNSAYTSTASLVPKSTQPPCTPPSSTMKNYQQAFTNLSSSFGLGGTVVPAPVVSSPRGRQQQSRAPPATQGSQTSSQQSQAAYWASQSHKNFEAAYGGLCSTYGFGGGVPTPKPRKL